MTWRLGLVAGEPSGDLIAARVLAGVQQADAEVRAEGIGGPQLMQQGLALWHPMQALTVFGYLDALKQVPTLVRTYLDVKRRWLKEPPSVFLGVDAPDFNLRLEHTLKQSGIPTVHLVSPSIWAWRYERIHHIREAVSHMLVMFPFEEALYQKENIPVTFVGHPLADAIAQEPDRAAARQRLGLDLNARVLAMLPGSRASEIKWIAPRFLQTVQHLQKRDPQLQVLVPMVNAARLAEFKQILKDYPVDHLHILTANATVAPVHSATLNALVEQRHASTAPRVAPLTTPLTTPPTTPLTTPLATPLTTPLTTPPTTPLATPFATPMTRPVAWDALEACDVALVASGTATLETALFKRPMVISYAVSPWVRRIMAWKSGQQRPYVPWVGLPNVLLNDSVVPELIQEDATPEKLAQAVYEKFIDERKAREIEARFHELHHSLRCDTASRAAEVILELAHRSRLTTNGLSHTDEVTP
jgi:lipid-A-disaccharide synthase